MWKIKRWKVELEVEEMKGEIGIGRGVERRGIGRGDDGNGRGQTSRIENGFSASKSMDLLASCHQGS